MVERINRREWNKRQAMALVLALAAATTASAAPPVAIAIRFHDDNPLAQGAALSASAQAELERAAGFPLVSQGRDGDGAFRFAFALPVDAASARAALNRVRATGAVLYADALPAADTRAKAAATGDGVPVTALIVVTRPQAKRGDVLATPARARLEAKIGTTIARQRLLAGGAQHLELDRPLSPADARSAVEKLASDPDVLHVEVDRRAHATATPSDPMFGQQWNLIDGLGGINAPAAWDIATGNSAQPVAIIDTGMLPHPDLAGRVVAGYDFISDVRFSNDGDGRDADPADPGDWVTSEESTTPGGALQACPVSNSTWHGTMVGGTLGAVANNGSGMSGVNWTSPLVNVRVMGKCGGALSDVADGIRWAAGIAVPGVPANRYPARVLNLSMAGPGACSPILQAAITEALTQGAVIVAAAGNGNDDVDNHWPANCNGVIAVAATSKNGSRAFYSSYGARIALSAPGGGIGGSIPTLRNTGTTSPDPNGYGYGQQLGSSLAAPHVAGVLSLALAFEADLGAAELRAVIESTARPFPTVSSEQCTTSMCGAGIVDAASALAALSARSPTDARPMPAPAPSPAPQPAPAPPATPAPEPVPLPISPEPVATTPPAFPVPVAGGWHAKRPEEIERLRKHAGAIGEATDAPAGRTPMSAR